MLCCGQRANISLMVPFCTKSSVSFAPPAIRWRVFKDWNPDDSGIMLWAWERKQRKMERKRFERDEMYTWDSFAFELIELDWNRLKPIETDWKHLNSMTYLQECHASFLEKTRHRTAIRYVCIAIRKGPLLISVKTPLGAQRKGETSVVLSPRIMFNLFEGMSFPIKKIFMVITWPRSTWPRSTAKLRECSASW